MNSVINIQEIIIIKILNLKVINYLRIVQLASNGHAFDFFGVFAESQPSLHEEPGRQSKLYQSNC